MTTGLRRELELFLTWMFFMLIVGAVFDGVLVALGTGMLLYIVWTFYNFNRISQWLAKPSKHTPESLGVWDEVFYQLYHLYKRQHRSRRKLASILKRFQKSTQALPYATIVLNANDEIEWFNPAASHMFQLRSQHDVGQRIDNLVRQPKFTNYLMKKKFEKPLEFQINQQQVLLNITPYGNSQHLLSARDITQRNQLDEMRRDFISNASHELRTPITVMSGYIEMLRENEDETTQIPLERIQQQTERMQNIISELIELAKLETSDVIETYEPIDSNKLIDEVFNEAIALDNGVHSLKLSIKPVTITGNYDELRMAFSNLLTNAIRYTPAGKDIELFTESDETGYCVGVRDQGIGINYEHIPRLTERFYRVDEGRSREKGGTGLGLAIVRQVLDRHSATLRIDSKPGQGSVFSCCFQHAN